MKKNDQTIKLEGSSIRRLNFQLSSCPCSFGILIGILPSRLHLLGYYHLSQDLWPAVLASRARLSRHAPMHPGQWGVSSWWPHISVVRLIQDSLKYKADWIIRGNIFRLWPLGNSVSKIILLLWPSQWSHEPELVSSISISINKPSAKAHFSIPSQGLAYEVCFLTLA